MKNVLFIAFLLYKFQKSVGATDPSAPTVTRVLCVKLQMEYTGNR